jgi:hypothetical protein
MRKEIVIKICDVCKKEVEHFVYESAYIEYLRISKNFQTAENKLDICYDCNDKIINFINSLEEE